MRVLIPREGYRLHAHRIVGNRDDRDLDLALLRLDTENDLGGSRRRREVYGQRTMIRVELLVGVETLLERAIRVRQHGGLDELPHRLAVAAVERCDVQLRGVTGMCVRKSGLETGNWRLGGNGMGG